MEVTVVVTGDKALEVGVITEDVVSVDGLAAAGREAHPVQEHAGADGRERVAGEVEVRHRVDDEVVSRGDHILQGVSGSAAHFLERDALHGLFDKSLALEIADEVIIQLILPAAGLYVALGQPLIYKGLDDLGVELEDLGHEVLKVDDLGAVIAENLSESVMLLLCDLQKRDIIEKKLRQTIGRKIEKLAAGTMKKHFFQRLYLAANANAFHFISSCY